MALNHDVANRGRRMHPCPDAEQALTSINIDVDVDVECGGREQTTRPKCNKFGKKYQHSGIRLLYLESL